MTYPQPAPNIKTGTSDEAGRTIRGGIQTTTGAFVVTGIMLFNVLSLTEAQAVWLGAAITIVLTAAQNFIESRRGRKLIGADLSRT